MSVGKLPPLVVLLLHLGACPNAVAWAGSKPITAASLEACERPDWRQWLAERLQVYTDEPAARWISAAKTALSGDGYGDGDGDGYGDGYGDGNGNGDGYGYGNGYGYGYGNGNGDGDGNGYGNGDGDGNGYGNGNGNSDIVASRKSAK